jgi:hypothetical protein
MIARKRSNGSMLIDMMVALAGTLLIGAGLTVLIQTTYSSQSVVQNENTNYASSRKALDIAAQHIQGAQAFAIGHSCIAAANATSVTFYTNSSGSSEKYWVDASSSPVALKRTATVSGVATTTSVSFGITSISFTYYLTDGVSYNSASFLSSTSSPASTDLPKIGAIGITAVFSSNGVQQTIKSYVRLRNSPYRI